MAVSALPIEAHVQRVADYLPGGRIFMAKNLPASNLRKLLTGIAYELFTADGYLADYQNDIAPSVTEYFIEEWESALGIPDSCFNGAGTFTERRRDIILKLASLGLQTAQDFVEIGALFGLTVTVGSAVPHTVFPVQFPIYFATPQEARFTIYVVFTVQQANRFTLTFPFIFGDTSIPILECLFRRLKPANCNIVFTQV